MNVPRSQSWEGEPGFQSWFCGSEDPSNFTVPTLDLASGARLPGDLGVLSVGLSQTSGWAAGWGPGGASGPEWRYSPHPASTHAGLLQGGGKNPSPSILLSTPSTTCL